MPSGHFLMARRAWRAALELPAVTSDSNWARRARAKAGSLTRTPLSMFRSCAARVDSADLATRLHLERGEIVFDADYVRGRMMKTRIVVGSTGRFTVETSNRHELALRWLDRLRGKKHIRLVAERPAGQDDGLPN